MLTFSLTQWVSRCRFLNSSSSTLFPQILHLTCKLLDRRDCKVTPHWHNGIAVSLKVLRIKYNSDIHVLVSETMKKFNRIEHFSSKKKRHFWTFLWIRKNPFYMKGYLKFKSSKFPKNSDIFYINFWKKVDLDNVGKTVWKLSILFSYFLDIFFIIIIFFVFIVI